MYSSDNARTKNLPVNQRAMGLMKACGHAVTQETAICGDVFVGRYHDDEAKDIWNRIDFTEMDLDPGNEWCQNAKQSGGGGGLGSVAPSLSGMMTKSLSGSGSGSGSGGTNVSGMLGNNGEQDGENGCKWSQTNEEVELRFQVASGTKAKYVKVAFARTTLKVTVAGQTLVSGSTGGDVAVDESTYTLQEVGGGKELAVTLGKKKEGLTWEYAVTK